MHIHVCYALVSMLKSAGGDTASNQGAEGFIWEGSLEGCLSFCWVVVSGHLRECPISGTLTSWLPAYSPNRVATLGLGRVSHVWAAAPGKKDPVVWVALPWGPCCYHSYSWPVCQSFPQIGRLVYLGILPLLRVVEPCSDASFGLFDGPN